MKISDAVQRYTFAKQAPGDRARFSVMKRVKRVWKMRNVASTCLCGQIQRFRIGLRVADEYAYIVSGEFSRKIETALDLGRQRHQSRRCRCHVCRAKQIYRSRITVVGSEVPSLQRATARFADKWPFEVDAKDASTAPR